MNSKEIVIRNRKQALLYQLDKCKCEECPLLKTCRLNDAVYKESICTALRNGQEESEDKLNDSNRRNAKM